MDGIGDWIKTGIGGWDVVCDWEGRGGWDAISTGDRDWWLA